MQSHAEPSRAFKHEKTDHIFSKTQVLALQDLNKGQHPVSRAREPENTPKRNVMRHALEQNSPDLNPQLAPYFLELTQTPFGRHLMHKNGKILLSI